MDNSFAIHPEAQSNFDKIALDLLALIEEAAPRTEDSPPLFSPDVHPSFVFTSDNILNFGPSEIRHSLTGEVLQQEFTACSKRWVLKKSGCDALRKLIAKINSHRSFESLVGPETTRGLFLSWAQDCIARGVQRTFFDYFQTHLKELVVEQEILVPIANLHVQSPLKIGNTVFKNLDSGFFDRQQWPTQGDPESTASKLELLNGYRRQYQGYAAAALKITAEPSFARLAAFAAAEKSVALLRLYSPEIHEPLAVSYMLPMGSESILSYSTLTVINDQITSRQQTTLKPHPNPFSLSDQRRELIAKAGLNELIALAEKQQPSNFEKKVLEALILYSKSATARELPDKLLLIIVALESMLLRDQSEPIQQNVGERLAFMLGESAKERKSIAGLLRENYSLRSKFVHHGQIPNEIEKVREFFHLSWLFFIRIIKICADFQEKSDFINDLDHMKFS